IGKIGLLDQQQQKALIQPDVPQATQTTLHQRFEAQARITPDNTALVCGEFELTYEQLNLRANQLAHGIFAMHPVKPDTLIALYLDPGIEMVISILAVLKAGAAYVPLSTKFPQERLAFIIEDTAAPLIITVHQYLPQLDELKIGAHLLAADRVLTTSTDNLPDIAQPTDLAYVIYTSGTTGQPKGVMIEHAGVTSFIDGQTRLLAFGEDERTIMLASFIFDGSVEMLFLTLFNGGALYVPTLGDIRDPQIIRGQIIDHGITHLYASPSYLLALGRFEQHQLRRVSTGGDVCVAGLKEIWGELLINEYGPTEVTITSTMCLDFASQNVPNCIGKPLPGTLVYVLDEAGELLPEGVPGELYIGGIGVARGYLNRPELTKERFVDNPFASGRMYRTGDKVRWLEDGVVEPQLQFLGRLDTQVKIRGFRIELGEIEQVLTGHKSVKQVVLTVCENGDDKSLAAYVVTESVTEAEHTLDANDCRTFLRAKLPHYMVPASFTFIDEVPLTLAGKLDRRALPEPDFHGGESYSAPTSTLEQSLCLVWQSVLGLQRVGINDNFFRIGGNSISAIRLTATISKRLACELPLAILFDCPTIAGIAPFFE
ncbi:MAG: amino acid adenylation domain-containing protein, partial [Psychrosphaera sp.]|nr:amino acid adenylation domain-containing protein [Psychrosphaera sp.]